MVQKLTILDMYQIAEDRRGKCLSKIYVNSQTKLKWKCLKGHIWEAIPNSICRGQWCKKCADNQKRFTIELMHNWARKHGGKCLSDTYIDIEHELKWECKNGHRWKQVPRVIVQGHWCNECFKDFRRPKIEEFLKLAIEKGAKCLSNKCNNANAILTFVCKDGHKFKSPAKRVKAGHWCPKCAWKKRSLLIENIRKIAKIRGGYLLSKKFINEDTPLTWKCKEGHVWKSKLSHIKDKETRNHIKVKGTWCIICARKRILFKRRYNIGHMKNIANERGGKCLSEFYKHSHHKLDWECKLGHSWKAVPSSILRGSWCPYCAKVKKLTIEEMQRLARSRGGECLSKEYTHSQDKLLWRCKEGHVWKSSPNTVKNGNSWCPVCGLKQMGEKHRGLKKFETYNTFVIESDRLAPISI